MLISMNCKCQWIEEEEVSTRAKAEGPSGEDEQRWAGRGQDPRRGLTPPREAEQE